MLLAIVISFPSFSCPVSIIVPPPPIEKDSHYFRSLKYNTYKAVYLAEVTKVYYESKYDRALSWFGLKQDISEYQWDERSLSPSYILEFKPDTVYYGLAEGDTQKVKIPSNCAEVIPKKGEKVIALYSDFSNDPTIVDMHDSSYVLWLDILNRTKEIDEVMKTRNKPLVKISPETGNEIRFYLKGVIYCKSEDNSIVGRLYKNELGTFIQNVDDKFEVIEEQTVLSSVNSQGIKVKLHCYEPIDLGIDSFTGEGWAYSSKKGLYKYRTEKNGYPVPYRADSE